MINTNVIYNEDCLVTLARFPSDSIDMVLTSPPYDNLRTYNGYEWDFEKIAHELHRVLKPGSCLVWVVGDSTVDGTETLSSFRQALYFKDVVGFLMHDTMIYEKGGAGVKKERYESVMGDLRLGGRITERNLVVGIIFGGI